MSPEVEQVLQSYPKSAQRALLELRAVILEVASEESLGSVSEVLKWNQISYLSKHGSTIRVGWSAESSEKYRLYCHCQTTLMETFRELYPELFRFEGNRAMVFLIGQSMPITELKSCISMALRYHKIKHLPLLGN